MAISRLGQRRQVVIPKEICEELGLSEGDFVELGMTRGLATVKPKKLVDPDDILTPEEEKRMRKGEAQLKRGKHVLWEDAKKKLKL
ncbi:MAG: AbrB/MazE/SpoVT family DNA-binding domain-containing protein [Acidobacteriota bacterium]|jgi:AbrB family looped-hinge helix DNA binding protein